jgi:hypothetical protein
MRGGNDAHTILHSVSVLFLGKWKFRSFIFISSPKYVNIIFALMKWCNIFVSLVLIQWRFFGYVMKKTFHIGLIYFITIIIISMAQQPLVDKSLLIVVASRSHSGTPHSVGLLWTSDHPTQRPLPYNTQLSQEIDIHTPGGIQTRNPSKRAAMGLRLRTRGPWDRLLYYYYYYYYYYY